MKTIKVSEATDPALDWLVAKCEGYAPVFTRHYVTPAHAEDPKKVCIPAQSWVQPFEPSTNRAQGGPIMDREKIGYCWSSNGYWHAHQFDAEDEFNSAFYQTGPTPLIAAMRCYVASKLGDTVEVPEELV